MIQPLDKVVGRTPVLECLRAKKRRAKHLYVLKSARGLDEILEAAKGLPIHQRTRGGLDQIAAGVLHQGVVLEAAPLPLTPLAQWLDTGPNLAVILDGVEDPHNFGAIVRSAAACGASGVLFGKDRAAPLSPAALKSAAGAMEYIDLVRVTNITRAIATLQDAGFWVAALEAEGDQTIWEPDLSGKIGLVIGAEGKGVRRLVRQQCDFHLRIPIQGPITSLNASASASIALVECLRQRSRGAGRPAKPCGAPMPRPGGVTL